MTCGLWCMGGGLTRDGAEIRLEALSPTHVMLLALLAGIMEMYESNVATKSGKSTRRVVPLVGRLWTMKPWFHKEDGMKKTVDNCKYNIPNYEFGPHDKGDACSLAYKDGYSDPASCNGVCSKWEICNELMKR